MILDLFYKRVSRYTRAGYSGKEIECPSCNSVSRVYHFAWSAIWCKKCDKGINKYDWIIKENEDGKTNRT